MAAYLFAAFLVVLFLTSNVYGLDSEHFTKLFTSGTEGNGPYNPSISPGDAYNGDDHGSVKSVVIPVYVLEHPTVVQIGLVVSSFDSVDSSNMEYSVTGYFQQTWDDKRLRFNASEFDGVNKLIIPYSQLSKLWLPDTMLVNSKSGELHTLTKPNQGALIFPNGTVYYSIRLTSKFACHMDLERFPMDEQSCPLIIESYMYDETRTLLKWTGDNAIKTIGLETAHFSLSEPALRTCHVDTVSGRYSRLRADFHLRRTIGQYVAQIYIPSTLVVMLSWVSFFIAVEATPARVSLGILAVLTMMTLLTRSSGVAAGASSMKSVDVWMATCMIFVVAALCEYAYANGMYRRHLADEKKKKKREDTKRNQAKNNNRASSGGTEHQEEGSAAKEDALLPEQEASSSKRCGGKRDNLSLARRIDRVSAFGFPVAFALFIMIYWLAYLLSPQMHIEEMPKC